VSLAAVVDALAERLRSGLPPATRVGDTTPTAAEVPAVTVAVRDAGTPLPGVGRTPRGTRRGALQVTAAVDLADPVVELDGDRVPLLSEDRRTLTLPHGQLVRADGTDDTPFDDEDITASGAGGPFSVVAGDPQPGEVRPDPVTGTLRFGAPLPATGTVTVTYHLGQWDVRTLRYAGTVDVAASAADAAATAALARQIGTLLDRPHPDFARLQPTAWGAVALAVPDADTPATQVLSYAFDFEREEPSLPSGGGLIRTVDVLVQRDATTQQFLVTREGSPA